jgi:hypothetical protein
MYTPKHRNNDEECMVSRVNFFITTSKERTLLFNRNIPSDLRSKILFYLEFMIEHRRKNKLNENQVLELLNDNLKETVIADLNGRILKECNIF